MPNWLYDLSSLQAAILIVGFVELVSIVGLLWTRRFAIPRFHYCENINEAVSGTVQAIGVFYGITVGLIAVAVWDTNTNAAELISREAASISALYRDVSGYPTPLREELRQKVRDYTLFTIDEAWPAQRRGVILPRGTEILDDFQVKLYSFEPVTQGQMALHSETLRGYNTFLEYRRLRLDSVKSGLSTKMWMVIWLGAAISIGVAYFYRITDVKLHAALVVLMAGFLGLVLFMITINDRPFYGVGSLTPDPYELIVHHVMDLSR
ncbi:MAG TPA: hypothetical protein VJS17_09960 [Pyrinomonadaceae bacterium]|nr:hypothetical protein [Pyrinomonadaceae bacterium]